MTLIKSCLISLHQNEQEDSKLNRIFRTQNAGHISATSRLPVMWPMHHLHLQGDWAEQQWSNSFILRLKQSLLWHNRMIASARSGSWSQDKSRSYLRQNSE